MPDPTGLTEEEIENLNRNLAAGRRARRLTGRGPLAAGSFTLLGTQALGARDADRDVHASSFRGGQVPWSPVAPINGEQKISHKLGKVPAGVFLLYAPQALQWFATPAQKARWTRDTIFFSIATHANHESGTGTLTTAMSSLTITLGRGAVQSGRSIQITSAEGDAGDHPPLKVGLVTTDPSDPARFISFDVAIATEVAPALNIDFSWNVWSPILIADEFVWQVI